MSPGSLVISLDFELRWGVRDLYSRGEYDSWLIGGRQAIPRILSLFECHQVAATWATVGFLFARDRDELMAHVPESLPSYDERNLSPYPELTAIGADERADPLSFAPSLLDQIAATPRQEVGSHTFSHFYVGESGQTAAQFGADLAAAKAISARFGDDACRSLVLPRNQWNPEYAEVAEQAGVLAYRVNRSHWAYAPAKTHQETPARRAYRLLDAYLPLSGSTTTRSSSSADSARPQQVVASQFLRPWMPRLRGLEKLRLARIQREIERAARDGSTYHLWWHPHNFGHHTDENLHVLETILGTYERMAGEFGMKSVSMGQLIGPSDTGLDHASSAR